MFNLFHLGTDRRKSDTENSQLFKVLTELRDGMDTGDVLEYVIVARKRDGSTDTKIKIATHLEPKNAVSLLSSAIASIAVHEL